MDYNRGNNVLVISFPESAFSLMEVNRSYFLLFVNCSLKLELVWFLLLCRYIDMAARTGKCVVHYDTLTLGSPNLTLLTSDTHQRLIQGKNARIKLGGAHFHEKQIKSLPTAFIPGEQYTHRQC